MTSIICAIAGSIATYGAVQMQLANPAGKFLLIGGLAITILAIFCEYFDGVDDV